MSDVPEIEEPQPILTLRSLILSFVIIVLVVVVVACAPAAGNVFSNIVVAL